MFEISIICVILLAISYWAVLWLMGRREDVLHGQFVKADGQAGEPARPVSPEPSVRPVFPEKPAAFEKPPALEKPAVLEQPAALEKPAAFEKPAALEKPPATGKLLATGKQAPTDITKPMRPAAVEQTPFQPERLESLLNLIKQDLNQLVQK